MRCFRALVLIVSFAIPGLMWSAAADQEEKKVAAGDVLHYPQEALEDAISGIWGTFLKGLQENIGHLTVGVEPTRDAVLAKYMHEAVYASPFIQQRGLDQEAATIEGVLLTAAKEVFSHDENSQKYVGVLKDIFAALEYADALQTNKNAPFSAFLIRLDQLVKNKNSQNAQELLDKVQLLLTGGGYSDQQVNVMQHLVAAILRITSWYNERADDLGFDRVYRLISSALAPLVGGARGPVELSDIMKERSLLFPIPKQLGWCPCPSAPFNKRLALAVRMVMDIARAHPDTQALLVYTSLASGSLLQDYLVISQLKHRGYNNLDINFVDIGIKDQASIHRTLDKYHGAEDEAVGSYITDVLNEAFFQAAFAEKIRASIVWSKKNSDQKPAYDGGPGVHVTQWSRVSDYIDFIQQNPRYKTDVLLLVDQSTGMYEVKQADQMNSIVIFSRPQQGQIQRSDAPYIKAYIAVPRVGIQIYAQADFAPLIQESWREFKVNHPDIWKMDQPARRALYTQWIEELVTGQDLESQGFDDVWTSDIYVAYRDIVEVGSNDGVLLYHLDADEHALCPVKTFTRNDFLKSVPFVGPAIRVFMFGNRLQSVLVEWRDSDLKPRKRKGRED